MSPPYAPPPPRGTQGGGRDAIGRGRLLEDTPHRGTPYKAADPLAIVDRLERAARLLDSFTPAAAEDATAIVRAVVIAWPALTPRMREGIALMLSRRAEVLLATALDLVRPLTPAERLAAELREVKA